MEVRGDHVGRLNEVGSGDRRPENIFLDVSSNGTQASGSQITQDSNGNTVSTDEYDLLLSNGQSNGWPHFSTSSAPSFKNDWSVFPPPNLSKDTNQTPFQKWDSFKDSFSARISPPRTSHQMTNIFEPFKEETSVSPRMPANEKPSDESDFLLEYMLANQKNDVESVSSTSASNHLNLFEDKFLPSPIIDDNIFTNTASSQSSDIFQTPGSSMQNNPLDQTSASVQYDHSKLSVNSAVNNGQFKPQDSHFDKLFMTTDMSNGLSQETSTLPPFLNASKDVGLMFRRRPPKPIPRIKARKNSLKNQNINHDMFSTSAESVPTDQKPAETLFTSNPPLPISKPTVPKPPTNIQGSVLQGGTKQSQVYEDVLFIGQEKCVEDWPEDSPELSPDWKPENVSASAEKENHRYSADLWAEYQLETCSSKPPDSSKKTQDLQDCRPSTPESDIPEKGADLFKATDIQGLEMNASEDYNQGLNNAEKGADLFKAGDFADDIWMEKHTMANDQLYFTEDFELPGATSGDYYLSEAAKAEWMSSQMDLRRVKTPEHVEKLEGVKEEEEGVSLPIRSFTEIAEKVHQGLRVFYKVFTEQAEVLYLHVLRLYAIGDDLSNFHRRAKIANITGGTTSAVGGAAVITGLALAPVTLGASLIVSAVGLGVAAAGGITAASATLSDNVHEMSDRKKIEVVLQDYETRLVELRRCLRFVAEGVRRMRLHPLLRRNNYYAGDWEVRRALQTISLVGDPVEQAEEIVQKSTMALNSVYKGMDNYFSKDSKELKKGCKKEVTMQVNMLAKLLHENLVVLNSTREHLMEATGFV
ncbi:hypothetical protein C0J50_24066 [Silurus asotus]|uniref:Uncharacterized protein n=1 Tax=Silurus asotus TaxID=30991 RepID=A0AAD5FGV7_SILAS|nr:hypothetical protein C0J50_24066 [Silurus asotus]